MEKMQALSLLGVTIDGESMAADIASDSGLSLRFGGACTPGVG
jgi:hypothetical protein